MSSVSESDQNLRLVEGMAASAVDSEQFSLGPDVPLDANARLALGYPAQNALNNRVYAVGPLLTNLFGTNAAAAAGAIGIRVRHLPGAGGEDASDLDGLTSAHPVISTGKGNDSRTFTLYYYGHDHSSAALGDIYPGRYGWRVKTNAVAQPADVAITNAMISPALDANPQGVVEALLVLRRQADGTFQHIAVQPGDTAVREGGTSNPAGLPGISSTLYPLMLGGENPGEALSNFRWFSGGDLSDLIQLDVAGTNAEWLRFANGEDPAVIWGANLAGYFRLGGPDDLAKTSGSRSYAAFTLDANVVRRPYKSCNMRPTVGTVTAANSLYVPGSVWGHTHALPSSALVENEAAQGGLAGMLAKTTDVFLPVVVGGTATKLDVRVVRDNDGLVIQDWTERTPTAVSGKVELTIPGVRPSGGLGHIYDVRRQDDPTCIFRCRNREDAGIVAAAGPSQSQVARAIQNDSGATGAGLVPLTAAAGQYVTFTNGRDSGNSKTYIPPFTVFVNNSLITTQGVHALANWWAEQFPGLRLNLLAFSLAGTGAQQWLENRVIPSTTRPYRFFGDGVNANSGVVTRQLLQVRKRISTFLVSWHTSERLFYLGNNGRFNELFGNVEAAAVDSEGGWLVPFASRQNLPKIGLVGRPHVTMFPVSREAIGAMSTSLAATNADFRRRQALWAAGTGRAASVDAYLGMFQNDTQLDGESAAHHVNSAPRGNLNFVIKLGQGLARAAGLTPSWGAALPAVSGVARTTARILTVSFSMPAGWTLRTPDAVPPGEFWVSEDDGTTWAKANTVCTPAVSGNTVTLTKGSDWAAAGSLRVQYNRGAPVSTGNLTTDNIELGGQLYAQMPVNAPIKALWAGFPTGVGGLVNGLPIAADLTARSMTPPGVSVDGARAVHAVGSSMANLAWRGGVGPESGAHGSTAIAAGLDWEGSVRANSALHFQSAGSATLTGMGDLQPLSGLMTVFDGPILVSIGGQGASRAAGRLVVEMEERVLRADF